MAANPHADGAMTRAQAAIPRYELDARRGRVEGVQRADGAWVLWADVVAALQAEGTACAECEKTHAAFAEAVSVLSMVGMAEGGPLVAAVRTAAERYQRMQQTILTRDKLPAAQGRETPGRRPYVIDGEISEASFQAPTPTAPACVCMVDDGLVQEWVAKARAVAKSKGYNATAPATGAPAEGWQPIATAPRDGTAVLGYGSEGVEIMHYEEAWGPSIDDPGHDAGWVGLYAFPGTTRVRRESHYWREAQGQPTHWQPLPVPPSVSGTPEEPR